MASRHGQDGPALASLRAGRFQVHQGYVFDSTRRMADPGGPSVLIDHAVLMLGVSKRTVYYWIRQGRLRTIRTRGGSQRVLVSSICRLSGSHMSAVGMSSSVPRVKLPDLWNSASA
jgi:excisionase family DNA binding protein